MDTGQSFSNGQFPDYINNKYGEYKFTQAVVKLSEGDGGLIYGDDVCYGNGYEPYYKVSVDNDIQKLYFQMRKENPNNNDEGYVYEIVGSPNQGNKCDYWMLGTYTKEGIEWTIIEPSNEYTKYLPRENTIAPHFVSAQNYGAYNVYDKNNKTINVMYGDASEYMKSVDYEVSSVVDDMSESEVSPFTKTMYQKATSIIFNKSFKEYKMIENWESYFRGFENLESITGFDNICTDKLYNIQYMFSNLPESFTSLDLNGFKLNYQYGEISSSNFISDNPYLKDVTFNGTDFNRVVYMDYFCSNNPEITTIDVSGLDSSNAKTIEAMFLGDKKLTDIKLKDNEGNSKFICESCYNYGGLFYKCESLKMIDLSFMCLYEQPDVYWWNYYMGYLCDCCTSLSEIDASNVQGDAYWCYKENDNDQYWTTGNCPNLNKISFGEALNDSIYTLTWDTGNWTDEEGNKINTEWVYEPGSYYKYYELSFGVSDVDAGMLKSDETFTVYPGKGEVATYKQGQDGSLTISVSNDKETKVYTNQVIHLAPDYYEFQGWIFEGPSQDGVVSGPGRFTAQYIDKFPGHAYYIAQTKYEPAKLLFTTEELSEGEYANDFRINKNLNTVRCESQEWINPRTTISPKKVVFDESFKSFKGLRNLDRFFRGMSTINQFEGFENIDCSKVVSMNNMFDGCSSVSELDVSALDTSKVESMSCMFSRMTNLATIKFVDNQQQSKFITNNVLYMNAMFSYDLALKNLDLSSFHFDSIIYDTSCMFEGSESLESVNLENFKLDYRYDSFGKCSDVSAMFSSCTGLQKLIIGESFNVFMNDTSLSSVYNKWININNGVTYSLPDYNIWPEGTYWRLRLEESVNLNLDNSGNQQLETNTFNESQVSNTEDVENSNNNQENMNVLQQEENVSGIAAILAAFPLVSVFGLRKRIFGKHVRP